MYDHQERNGYRITTNTNNGEISIFTFAQLDVGISSTMLDIFWDEFYNHFLQNDEERDIVEENMFRYGHDDYGSIRIEWVEINGDVDPKLKPILERFYEVGYEMDFFGDVLCNVTSEALNDNMMCAETQEERDSVAKNYIETCLKYYPNSTPDDFKGDFDYYDVDAELILAQVFFMREAA